MHVSTREEKGDESNFKGSADIDGISEHSAN
jgi:hypothetical protein